MKTSKKREIALVHLINCKLFQSFYKHKIVPGSSFHIASVLKAYCRVCRETNRKLNLKGKSPVIAFVHLYEHAAVRAGAPLRSTQESHFETSK